MRMKTALGFLLFALAVGISSGGCAKKVAEERSVAFGKLARAPVTGQAAQPSKAQAVTYQLPEAGALAAAVSTRKVITTAYRTVQVGDVVQAFKNAQKIPEMFGGFVQSSRLERGTVKRERRAELVLRMPVGDLDRALKEIDKMGEVLDSRAEGKDVTEEWVDLDSRTRNLRKEEGVLLDLMGMRAKSLSEVLEVEKELARVRGEIEKTEGRIRMLSEQVSLATINLALVETGAAVRPIPRGLWAMRGTVTHAIRTAMMVARALVGLVVWIVMFGVVWVPALAIFFGARYALRRIRKTNT